MTGRLQSLTMTAEQKVRLPKQMESSQQIILEFCLKNTERKQGQL